MFDPTALYATFNPSAVETGEAWKPIVPTAFEVQARHAFERFQKTRANALIVYIPAHGDEHGYKFHSVDSPDDPRHIMQLFQEGGGQVLMALDLSQAFENQWPYGNETGIVYTPIEFEDCPIIHLAD